MALPYIIVSGLLGGISYSYYTTISKLELKDSSINYSLIDSKMKELVVTSNVSPSLGVNFKDKCVSIIKICNEDCNSKRTRKRLGKYIKEYERIGLDRFIHNHKKN